MVASWKGTPGGLLSPQRGFYPPLPMLSTLRNMLDSPNCHFVLLSSLIKQNVKLHLSHLCASVPHSSLFLNAFLQLVHLLTSLQPSSGEWRGRMGNPHDYATREETEGQGSPEQQHGHHHPQGTTIPRAAGSGRWEALQSPNCRFPAFFRHICYSLHAAPGPVLCWVHRLQEAGSSVLL